MTELGLTQSELAESAGISQVTVHKLISGKINKTARIIDLASALKCDPTWLLNGTGAYQPLNEEPIKTIYGQQPIISWSQAINWSDDQQAGLSDKDWFPCPVDCSDQTFVLRVRGISMAPRFAEGDLIFVDPAINPVNGKYVIVRLGDEKEASFKMIIIEGAQKYLKADNPDWPAPILPIDSNCQIIGTIVFAGRQL